MLLGADVGSAVATTVFASGASSITKSISPLLVFLGYVVFSFSREERPHTPRPSAWASCSWPCS
ncbi:MAG: hypothetical protein U1E15_12280 [Hyphomicrobiales bacterium]